LQRSRESAQFHAGEGLQDSGGLEDDFVAARSLAVQRTQRESRAQSGDDVRAVSRQRQLDSESASAAARSNGSVLIAAYGGITSRRRAVSAAACAAASRHAWLRDRRSWQESRTLASDRPGSPLRRRQDSSDAPWTSSSVDPE